MKSRKDQNGQGGRSNKPICHRMKGLLRHKGSCELADSIHAAVT